MSNYTISSFISYVVDNYRQRQSKLRYSTNELSIFKNDIQTIICDILCVDRTYLYLNLDKGLDSYLVEKINTRVNRYLDGEPLAYILGYKYFWDQKLFVTQYTLIPRADTETLVEAVLNDIANKSAKLNILDLGTGTGAIAIALASELSYSHVVAVDASHKALEVAKKNAKANKVSNVEFIQSDWYKNLGDRRFDIIVSNPPYIDFSDENITQEVKEYEPQNALFSQDNGLADIKAIISQSHLYLNKNARMYIEHGYTEAKFVENILVEYEFSNVKTIKDLNQKDRCTHAVFSKSP